MRGIDGNPFALIESVIDQNLRHRLQELRDRESLTCWDLGRLVNDIYRRAVKNRTPITKDDVCIYVARQIDSRDRSVASITLYARIADHYKANSEGKYPVPFSHFVEAAKFGENRYNVLALSLELMDSRGGAQVSADTLGRIAEGRNFTRIAQDDEPPMPQDQYPTSYSTPNQATTRSPAFARLRQISRELTQIASELKKDYPFWAKTAAQLSSLCDRILREMDEIEVTAIDV